MKADNKTEFAVMEVINKLIKAFETKDIENGLALFAPDPDVVFIGTGADEKCIGLAEIKAEFERSFSQSEELSIKLDWYSVSAAGPVAWVTADASIYAKVGGQETHFPIRLTTVLEQRNGRWLMVQSHDSLPAASQKDGESFPMEH